jgi:hypothetical protein
MREYAISSVCDQQLNMPKITQELHTARISCDAPPAASRLSCFRAQIAKLGSKKGHFRLLLVIFCFDKTGFLLSYKSDQNL